MKILFVVMAVFIMIGGSVSAWADLSEYTVLRTNEKIVIDGILDEQDWATAKPVGEFKFPWWTEGEKEQTEVKMLWDDTFLYVAFRCDDKHIWADHYDTNSKTYMDDCVEIFWNPDPEGTKKYNMFEMNCIGNLLSVYTGSGKSIYVRESRIMVPHLSQSIQGTVNNDSDIDTGWILEIAIRFSDYPELSKRLAPITGDMWRVGLNRCGGKTNEQYSQWSPEIGEKPSFHLPDYFGEIFFGSKPVGVEENAPSTFSVAQNLPNPFNPTTTISFTLPVAGMVSIDVYNVAGQKVDTIVNEYMNTGSHSVVWDGSEFSTGVYFYTVKFNNFTKSMKMTLIK